MTKRILKKASLTALMFCASVSAGYAMTREEVDAKWNAIVASQDIRMMGQEQACQLRTILDEKAIKGGLYELWQGCGDAQAAIRIQSAWSILKNNVPGGDLARWNEVGYFQLPQQIPNAFMIIDALYTSLIELPNLPGGEWLAADLLRSFSRSSHGRLDFLTYCPEPVAKAITDIVKKTGLRGDWTVHAVGSLPIARSIEGTISDSSSPSGGMVYLDGAGIPASNGDYVWDRTTGKIYEVKQSGDSYLPSKP